MRGGKFYLHICKKWPSSTGAAGPAGTALWDEEEAWVGVHGVGGGAGNTFHPEQVAPAPQKPAQRQRSANRAYIIYWNP